MEDIQNHTTDHESVSSEPSVDSLFNFIPIQNNHQISSANSSINLADELGTIHNELQTSQPTLNDQQPLSLAVGLGVQYGSVGSEQDRLHQINPNTHPNKSGFQNFPQPAHLSLSLEVASPNPTRSYISASHPPLFGPVNWEHQAFENPNELVPHQLAPPKFNDIIKKRARENVLKHRTVTELSLPGGINGNGRLPLFVLKKNHSNGRINNSVYDIMFEEAGQPIDPHLRYFHPI